MLIVLDTKTAMARLINQEDLFSTVMLSKLENYFSYAVAESAKKDIMATARFPNINCVIKNGDSLYSLDFHNMNIQEISIEELIPIQQTDFGEKVFSETIEEFKYCVGDFYYGTQITLIEYPLICFESAEVFNIIPRIKTASSDILEILSEYFSNNSLQDLKTEILNYMGSHCTMMVENKKDFF